MTGNNSGKTATASLRVNAGELDRISISPASATIKSGGSQTYTAQAFDSYGNSLGNVTGATSFSIVPDGSCTGATCTATVVGARKGGRVTFTGGGADAAPCARLAGAAVTYDQSVIGSESVGPSPRDRIVVIDP